MNRMDSLFSTLNRVRIRSRVTRITTRFHDAAACLLAPQTCVVCGKNSRRSVPLCLSCEAVRLGAENTDTDRCERCGRPLVSSRSLCVDCRTVAPLEAIDRVYPLYPYDHTAQELLAAWKLSGNFGLTAVFAGALARELSRFPHCTVVPVPPRPGKIRKKGWDQIDVLVRHLERNFGIPVLRCLSRTSLIQQKGLGKTERRLNLKGNIAYIGKKPLSEPIVLVDDLMTTGATLDSCAAVLKGAQSPAVFGMTLFYD